ncbi:hypothetical protein [Treponema putidum]|uniref:Uncharacterized protein n=1 Tax=Treponema putidum TaxID=221027 RepID=A0AAE9MTX0_9SPIR|nr:hypothetical protein [Treponema putidum]AIN94840.1 hypothetical protein JO40_12880 [Treponema putidum]TWI77173.1 hypothetical protein JM98_01470 [Treponema putidum]UTY31274.1 hypothetical protein E4N75_06940 [Treponema putidum]UTY33711.1 hypothetical protein E4N74_06585 [Treponema putidum]
MSKGLIAAEALIDAAIEYDSSVLKNKEILVEKVLKAVNSVLSSSSKYVNEGAHLKCYVKQYLEDK